VSTATATVGGQSLTILTDAQGHTLYYFADDTSTHSACTSGCSTTWPPLLISSGTPSSSSSLPGTLSASDVGNGQQVLYNGHPLYHYSGDTAPGDTHGDGIEGKWHVATPDLAANRTATPSGQPTPTKCSGYYCY
jgi:predicted lipoprotein with Yx(FWY)xxD motif